MPKRIAMLLVIGTVCGAATLAWSPAAGTEPAPVTFTNQQIDFFQSEVKPILQNHCWKCHGESKVKAGLSLASRAAILKGGDTGPAVNLAKPGESLLLKAVNYQELEMPPTGKLPRKDIDVLTRWLKEGLPWTPGEASKIASKERHSSAGGVVTDEAKKYWAYQPVVRPTLPKVKDAGWVKTPIDAFILAKLEEKGLRPAPPADRVALIRRAYYDLIGLPPTPEEVDAFVADADPDAFAKVVDRLLASPHHGEKWGRHWLDLVRYAETNGYERDGIKPFAWRFRDYVIRSFNDDKPYDQIIREQLAGDEMPERTADQIIATGFYRLGLWDDEPVDPEQSRYDELDDYVATTSQVFLAMTMNCARCHEHKIDPIPQADYYRLLAFFQDVPHFSDTRDVSSRFNLTDITPIEKRQTYEEELRQRQDRIDALTKEITEIENEAIKKMPAEDQRASEGLDRPLVVRKVPEFLEEREKGRYARLKRQVEELKKRPTPSQEFALSVNNCKARPVQTHVLIRGNPHAKGAPVAPGFPAVLGVPDPEIPVADVGARTSGRRTHLANWITSPRNPLTARVMANRIWQHHFGRGIVPTPNDFGRFGAPPTHPELLDWLASEFMSPSPQPSPQQGAGGNGAPQGQEGEKAWTLKRMHRLIMLSNAYQMSSRADAEALQRDPANDGFWRFNPRRLAAEEVRDSFLAVSGRLNPKMFGPSIYPPIPREVLAGQSKPGEGWGRSSGEEASRRSIYVHVKRSLLLPILSQHDLAETDGSCPVRYVTTVPTQALGMLNGEFANEQAAALAERLRRECPGDVAAQVRRAIRLTTGRSPSDEEVARDVAFIASLPEEEALRCYCLLALNVNEFLYLD